MKNTIEVVKFGAEELGISPDEMFSLIESSRGYTGDDYSRWLANEIIKLAEKDGLGYSQLLVKKFAIISSILEDIDISIRQEWVDIVKGMVNCRLSISVNFPEFAPVQEGADWFNGIDLISSKDFSSSAFSEEFYDNLTMGDVLAENFAIYAKLESGSVNKNSDLFKSAKNIGIQCKNEGSLLLYRMCNLTEAWDLGEEFRFVFFANTKFLTDVENKDIISHFLKYFVYTGFTIDSVDLLDGASLKNEYAFCVCKPRITGVKSMDGFRLTKKKLSDTSSLINKEPEKLYSRSSTLMLDSLLDSAVKNNCECKMSCKGELTSEQGEGYSKAMGYLNIPQNKGFNCSISRVPEVNSFKSIPITKDNFEDVVCYFSIVHSLSGSGLSSNIKNIMTGSKDYKDLFYNCLPLFLFDTENYLSEIEGYASYFNVETSDFIKGYLEAGEIHFSYESKQLLNICKGFLDFLKEDAYSLTFEVVRKEANHTELNKQYLAAIVNIKDYIRSIYRKVE